MKRIVVPTQSGSDWQPLLAKPSLHWKRGKSAMTAAACWEAAHPFLPPEISSALDASDEDALARLELLLAVPEWEVPLPGGSTASHTDLLGLARNEHGMVVLAVEAKVDEPFGPTLREKLTKLDESTREEREGFERRLEFLHRTLGLLEPLGWDIRYQLLHRAASAVLTARMFHAPTAVMVIHSFSPSARWRSDYEAFCSALGATPGIGRAVSLPSPGPLRLFGTWCAGDAQFLDVQLPAAPSRSGES